MALEKALMALAIGVGCRTSCSSDAIVALVERALQGRDRSGARLFTLSHKADETNLIEAARLLGLPLMPLSADVLREAAPRITVRSQRVLAAVGVPSVAEASALAGAGPDARLVVPRVAQNGATCAVAIGRGMEP